MLRAAFRSLTRLVQTLPDLGGLYETQFSLEQLAKVATELADPELDRLVQGLDALFEQLVETLSGALTQPFRELTQAVLTPPVRGPADMERMLWRERTVGVARQVGR